LLTLPWDARASHRIGLYTYQEHMQERLTFLREFLEKSARPSVLTKAFAEFFFDACIKDAICEEEHQMIAQWFS